MTYSILLIYWYKGGIDAIDRVFMVKMELIWF